MKPGELCTWKEDTADTSNLVFCYRSPGPSVSGSSFLHDRNINDLYLVLRHEEYPDPVPELGPIRLVRLMQRNGTIILTHPENLKVVNP